MPPCHRWVMLVAMHAVPSNLAAVCRNKSKYILIVNQNITKKKYLRLETCCISLASPVVISLLCWLFPPSPASFGGGQLLWCKWHHCRHEICVVWALCHCHCCPTLFLSYIIYIITCIYIKMMLVYKNTMKFKKKHTHLWPKRHETHVIWAPCHRFHHTTLFLSCIM